MGIWVNKNTRVVVQGLTGSQGRYYGLRNRDYGTQIVAGTNPKKAGTDIEGIPIYASVKESVNLRKVNTSFVIVPAAFARAAVMEAAEAGIKVIICVTEHIPTRDQMIMYNDLRRNFPEVRLIGPNCAGIISPGICNIGFTPGYVAKGGGPVGVVSRSGTLAYQTLFELTQSGIGQTTCVGIGGDPVPGTSFIDVLEAFSQDLDTDAVVLIGEIGGSEEEEAAQWIEKHLDTSRFPVVAYIAGVTAPPGKRMGHAGAIVSGNSGTAKGKIDALKRAGVIIAKNPAEIGTLMQRSLQNREAAFS